LGSFISFFSLPFFFVLIIRRIYEGKLELLLGRKEKRLSPILSVSPSLHTYEVRRFNFCS
jgi:hypothetical protein